MTSQGNESGPSRSDQVNTRRMLKVVIALTLAMAVGLGLCWMMPEPNDLPEVYRLLRPRGMADLADWQSIVIRDSGDLGGWYDPQAGHFIIGNGRGQVLADGQMISTALWKAQQPWSPPREAAGVLSGSQAEAVVIVVAGDFRVAPPSDEQLGSLVKLVYELSSRYRTIPLTHVQAYWELIGHPADGAAFPMSRFLRDLGEDHRRK